MFSCSISQTFKVSTILFKRVESIHQPHLTYLQCDQIRPNFATWVIFGYILLNQVWPKQVVLTHGLQLQYFKLSIDVDIWPFWATFFSKHWAKLYSIFWSHCYFHSMQGNFETPYESLTIILTVVEHEYNHNILSQCIGVKEHSS